jgi:hypothetical protein
MGKLLIILLLVFSGYGAYNHFNKFKGEKIPEHKLTKNQKEERQKNKKLAVLEPLGTESHTSLDSKKKVPPQIIDFVKNQLEEWNNLTPGEKNELKHLSSRIEQRLPFGNYEKTLVKKLEDRNVLEAIRQNNSSVIKNTGNVIYETNQYDTNFQQNQEPDDFNENDNDVNRNSEQEPMEPQMPEEGVQEDLRIQEDQYPLSNGEEQSEQEPFEQDLTEPYPEPTDQEALEPLPEPME